MQFSKSHQITYNPNASIHPQPLAFVNFKRGWSNVEIHCADFAALQQGLYKIYITDSFPSLLL